MKKKEVSMLQLIETINNAVNNFIWGVPAMICIIGVGLYLSIRTGFLQIRKFPYAMKTTVGRMLRKREASDGRMTPFQAVCTALAATVGTGNIAGVAGAIAIGGPGAVFWMWITALLGSSTAFIEGTLAQLHKEKDPLYGGYHGGPAYYMHHFFAKRKDGTYRKYSVLAVLFAISGLICWCGISQVISNSVTSAFENAFSIPPLATTIILVVLAAIIVLRKNATVKVLDIMVPIMACAYFIFTVIIILTHLGQMPDVFARIFQEAFGFRQVAAGGFGAVLMNGVKRGLFSNEAGSGSAPCAAAAAKSDDAVKIGLVQSLGVFIDTIVICTCTAMILLLVPQELTNGLVGMDLLQTAMQYHLGTFGTIFIAATLAMFSFSTFIGILFYARSNVAYLFGNKWCYQTAYKIVALIMLFIGGLAAYTTVWDLGDVGVGLMTIFNLIALYPMGGQALKALRDAGK